MKLLITASTALLTLALLGSAALAGPGDRRGDRWDDRDDYGYVDDYDEARTYYVPDFDRRVQRGMAFHEVRRMLRGQLRARVAQKTRMIRARHGFTRRANRMISRMETRERLRFERRMASAKARFDRLRRYTRTPRYAPTPTYAPTPVYVPTPPTPRYDRRQRHNRF